jgi:uncharacterized protein
MQVYLPIAELSVNAFYLLLLGGGVGFLSGLFGVGGGFLMTPLLIFIGVPPAVAVGTQANQLVGASVSGAMAHWRKRNVDLRLGSVMMVGGGFGTGIGVWVFSILQQIGQIDAAISIMYVLFLGTIGGLMLWESVGAIIRGRNPLAVRSKLHHHTWLHGLPFKMKFPRSRLYISALLPAGIGFVGGMLVAIMGIGGGFLLVPAMIYLLGMPTALVAGTSLFQIIFTTGIAAFLQAVTNHTVDILLALLLLVGGVVGAQFGTRFGARLRGEQARAMLAVMVLLVASKLFLDLVIRPEDLFSITLPPPT